MSTARNVRMLVRYKAWANELIYTMVSELPEEETLRDRKTRFGNMVHTLNHVYVIDSVFQAHLQGRLHGYSARPTCRFFCGIPRGHSCQRLRRFATWSRK